MGWREGPGADRHHGGEVPVGSPGPEQDGAMRSVANVAAEQRRPGPGWPEPPAREGADPRRAVLDKARESAEGDAARDPETPREEDRGRTPVRNASDTEYLANWESRFAEAIIEMARCHAVGWENAQWSVRERLAARAGRLHFTRMVRRAVDDARGPAWARVESPERRTTGFLDKQKKDARRSARKAKSRGRERLPEEREERRSLSRIRRQRRSPSTSSRTS